MDSKFNEYLLNIFEEVIKIDSDPEIAIHYRIIKTIISQKPDFIIKKFYGLICEYKEEIYSGDENFFMNLNFQTAFGIDDEGLSSVFKFTEKWKQLSQETRDKFIKLIQLITFLSDEYNNTS